MEGVGEEAAATILEVLRGAVSNASREPVGLSEGCLKQDWLLLSTKYCTVVHFPDNF